MKKIIRLCVILFAMFIGINYVEAFSIGASSTTIASGQTARLTINGSGFIGKYSISTSNAGVVAASEGSVWIEDGSYSITLSGLNVGSATITVTASDVSDTAGNPASGSQSVTINVVDRASSSNQKQQKDKKDMSKNNDLKNLSVEGFTLTPEFDKNKLEYDVTVPEDTKEINIIAQALDSNASIDGAGKKEVTEGTNTFDIIVRAENGDKKTYKINVLVKDENPINVTVDNKKYTVAKVLTDIEIPNGYKEKTIKINDQDIPALYNKITKFTLVGLKDESGKITLFIYNKNKNTYTKYNELKANQLSILPLEFKGTLKGYEKTTITINGEKVEAYKYKKNSNYAIIYGLNLETGDKDYYLYNSEDGSLIIYDDQLINDLQNTIDLYTYIIIGLASAFVLLLIILIVVAKKKKKNNKKNTKEEKETKTKNKKDKNDIFEL